MPYCWARGRWNADVYRPVQRAQLFRSTRREMMCRKPIMRASVAGSTLEAAIEWAKIVKVIPHVHARPGFESCNTSCLPARGSATPRGRSERVFPRGESIWLASLGRLPDHDGCPPGPREADRSCPAVRVTKTVPMRVLSGPRHREARGSWPNASWPNASAAVCLPGRRPQCRHGAVRRDVRQGLLREAAAEPFRGSIPQGTSPMLARSVPMLVSFDV